MIRSARDRAALRISLVRHRWGETYGLKRPKIMAIDRMMMEAALDVNQATTRRIFQIVGEARRDKISQREATERIMEEVGLNCDSDTRPKDGDAKQGSTRE